MATDIRELKKKKDAAATRYAAALVEFRAASRELDDADDAYDKSFLDLFKPSVDVNASQWEPEIDERGDFRPIKCNNVAVNLDRFGGVDE